MKNNSSFEVGFDNFKYVEVNGVPFIGSQNDKIVILVPRKSPYVEIPY